MPIEQVGVIGVTASPSRRSFRGFASEGLRALSVALENGLPQSSLIALAIFLSMRFLFATVTLADVLPVAVVVAVQVGHSKGGCPYPAHHFIDVLAKVGYVKNPSSISQVRISQVFS
jgi:hypothetical protein